MFLETKRNTYVLLLAILLIAFTARLLLVSQSDYIAGTDGGFYAYQTKLLLETGSLEESWYSNPLIFYVSAFFALAFGVQNGVLIATAIFSVLLGLSAFIFVDKVMKDRAAAVIISALVTFSPLALRLMADLRKNVAGLFFVPLFLYFVWKSFEDKRYLIAVAITGALGLFAHRSIAVVWFIVIGYFAFLFGMKKKLERNEIHMLLLFLLPALLATFLFPVYVSDGFNWISEDSGSLSLRTQGLEMYLLPLLVGALPAIFFCLKRQEKKDLFLLSWLLIAFLFTLPGISGANQWRFLLPFFLPLSIATGISLTWLFKKKKYVGIFFGVLLGIIILSQFIHFGFNDFQMQTKLPEGILHTLDTNSEIIPEGSVILTNADTHSWYWLKYFFGVGVQQIDMNTFGSLVNEGLENSSEVYLIILSPTNNFALELEPFEKIVDEQGVGIYTITETQEEMLSVPIQSATEVYDTGRLQYLSSYLILPYEFLYMLDPPYVTLFLVFIGIPASVLLLGIILAWIITFLRKQKMNMQYSILVFFLLLILVLYTVQPEFFWGENREHQGQAFPQPLANPSGFSTFERPQHFESKSPMRRNPGGRS